ncbi:hypothetical protein Nepgr_003446 [Nepenthes gracilis]|uniref:Exostosin GT47 domain-containing protein n=1 Tax=Nepenthes gracilis TaxID=150966 RepID=A0AAD3RZM4_NEPGR|nr:hypothetical protein Nepgr_003446 [Nepenthes gracilis]
MASKITILLPILTALYLLPTTAVSRDTNAHTDSGPLDCTNRWIYIRQLPSRFNLDLLTSCSNYYPLYDDFCPYIANHGLGQATHNRSKSWFRTDPHMLEVSFHRRILEYPCLTSVPETADAIFIPYYAGIDALRYLYGSDVNSSSEHGLNLFNYMQTNEPEIWGRNLGHDHFLVMARSAWDFSQAADADPPIWGTSFLELPQFYNVTALTLESRAWSWQEQAIPHPTSFHPSTLALLESWVLRVRRSHRSTLMLFAGGGGTSTTPNIRRSIRETCLNDTRISDVTGRFQRLCEIVDCSNGACEHDPIRYMKPMLHATFCLQPPGDTPARRSTFDGILAGCIPVFFEDQSARIQYRWHLPSKEFEEFSVTIPKEDVVYRGLSIVDVLMRIPRGEVRRMRERVMELIPRVIYRKHGSSLGLRARKDAFDVAIEGTLKRIHSRLRER